MWESSITCHLKSSDALDRPRASLKFALTFCVTQVDNGMHAPLADTDIDNFDRVMNINARGNLLCVRAEAAAMREQTPKTWAGRNGTREIGRGVIVNIASANSFAGLPGKGSYTISKHASMGITKMAGK